MKATARTLLSATTVLGLIAFTVLATSASVAAASLGLLVVYGLVEMVIHSYAPRQVLVRRAAPGSIMPPATNVIEFPSCSSRERAA